MKQAFKKAVSVMVIVAFLGLTVACERTVTKYDSNGQPYTATEFSAWETVGAIILLGLVLGAFAANSQPDDGSFLNDAGSLVASAYALNAPLPTKYTGKKWIRLVDARGNVVGTHLVNLDALYPEKRIFDLAEVQLSSDIDRLALWDMMHEITEGDGLESIPNSVKATVSSIPGSDYVLRIDEISRAPDANPEKGDSVLVISSENGLYRIITKSSANMFGKEEATRTSVMINRL